MEEVDQPPLHQKKLAPFVLSGAQRRKAVEALLSRATPGAVRVMADTISHHKDPGLRQSLLDAVRTLAGQGNDGAQEVLCRLVVGQDDAATTRTVLDQHYRPREPRQRALFLFLTRQWEEYRSLDFDGSLLKTACAQADQTVRRRVAARARASGRLEWIEAVSGRCGQQDSGDLLDEEWDGIVSILSGAQQWEALWRVAQEAPAFWGVRSLAAIAQAGWQPENPADHKAFGGLVDLALACENASPGYHSSRRRSVVLQAGDQAIRHIACSPDGALVAAVAYEPGGRTQAVSPVETLVPEEFRSGGRALWIPAEWRGQSTRSVSAIAVAPGAREMALASCSTAGKAPETAVAGSLVEIRSVDGFERRVSFSPAGVVRALAFTPDGKFLAAAGERLELWRADGVLEQELTGHSGAITALAISPDGAILASGSADRTIRLWEPHGGIPVKLLKGHTHNVNGLAFSPDGSLLVSSGKDGLRVWALPCGSLRASIPVTDPVCSLAVTTGGHGLVTGHETGTINVLSLPDGKLLTAFPPAASGPVTLAAGETLAAGYSSGALHLWRWEMAHLGHTPVARMTASDLEWAQRALDGGTISEGERCWLMFLATLLKWRWRFAIEVVELSTQPRRPAGEYDIEIEG